MIMKYNGKNVLNVKFYSKCLLSLKFAPLKITCYNVVAIINVMHMCVCVSYTLDTNRFCRMH